MSRSPARERLRRIEIAIAWDPGEAELPEKMVYCDPVHVARIELIDPMKRKRDS